MNKPLTETEAQGLRELMEKGRAARAGMTNLAAGAGADLEKLRSEIRATEAKLPEHARPHAAHGYKDPGATFNREMLEARLGAAKKALAFFNDAATRRSSAQPPPLPGSREALEARIAQLEKDLAAAKAAPSAAAGARIVETAARTTATQLSAERRAPTIRGHKLADLVEEFLLAELRMPDTADATIAKKELEARGYIFTPKPGGKGFTYSKSQKPMAALSTGETFTTKQGEDDDSKNRYQFGNHHAKQITEDWMPWHAGQPDYPDGPTREEIARKYPHFAHLHSLPSSQQNAYYNSNVEVLRRETQGVNSELEKLPACPLTLQHHSMERIEAAEFMKANAVGIARELRAFRAVLSRNNDRLERIYRADAAARNQEKARQEQAAQTSRR